MPVSLPIEPTSKQILLLMLAGLRGSDGVIEALYGGSAGGGKSVALLLSALQYVDVPSYSAIIFRKTYTDLSLPGAVMSKSHELLQHLGAKWSDREKTWTFKSGATFSFGYLSSRLDRYRYQGAEFQFVGFDELTQHDELDYRYLFSRLRRLEDSSVPLRMFSASNPGGVGHEWVKRRMMTEGPQNRRVFIPAAVDDNPHLDKKAYISSLLNLDPVTRRQLLDGDWSARASGSMFRAEWFPVITTAPSRMRMARYWDLASGEPKNGSDPDFTAGALVGMERGENGRPVGRYVLMDMRRIRATPHALEKLIRETAERDGREVPVLFEQEPGSSGKLLVSMYQRAVLPGFQVHGVRSTGDKVTRAGPVSSAAEAGNVSLLDGRWIGDFLDEAEAFPQGSHDDQVDALSGAVSWLSMHPLPDRASYAEITSRYADDHQDRYPGARWDQRRVRGNSRQPLG